MGGVEVNMTMRKESIRISVRASLAASAAAAADEAAECRRRRQGGERVRGGRRMWTTHVWHPR